MGYAILLAVTAGLGALTGYARGGAMRLQEEYEAKGRKGEKDHAGFVDETAEHFKNHFDKKETKK